jgi:hypothetical protein
MKNKIAQHHCLQKKSANFVGLWVVADQRCTTLTTFHKDPWSKGTFSVSLVTSHAVVSEGKNQIVWGNQRPM